jgi:MSHA biogenesis protein MshN
MSLINKMLQDLDERHAVPGTAPAFAGRSGSMAEHVRSVRSRRISGGFWYIVATVVLVAVGGVGWVLWQPTPHPGLTDLADQSSRTGAPKAVPGDQAGATPGAEATGPSAVAESATATAKSAAALVRTAAVSPSAHSAPAKAEPARPDILRLATELTTPIPARRERPAAKEIRKPGKSGIDGKTLATLPPDAPLRATAVSPAPGHIDRRASGTVHERAEDEYRRAVNLVNLGRVAEGMEGFRKALQIDPEHEAVRQTLVALLLEAKRVSEAAALLTDGLALNPSNTGFAMLLARTLVERDDIAGALELLQKHALTGSGNADYHAFVAALYQRLDRHKEAVEEYQTALRLAPAAGVWWIGLGISQQALDRRQDALAAFKRAKETGNLAPELVVFADQRVKRLQ